MIKRLYLITIFIVALTTLVSCCGGHVSDDMALEVCTTYSIPGFHKDDLKGPSSVEILETDSYGRWLYKCKEYNVITNKEEAAIVICQKLDDHYVYFYEDKNYLAYEYTETDIAELKIKNDWDQPLNEDKMTKCKIQVSFDMYNVKSGHNETRDFCDWLLEKTEIESSDNLGAYFVLSDSSENDLYILCMNYETRNERFAVIVTPDKDVYYMPVNQSTTPQDYMNFKLSHGWKYPY